MQLQGFSISLYQYSSQHHSGWRCFTQRQTCLTGVMTQTSSPRNLKLEHPKSPSDQTVCTWILSQTIQASSDQHSKSYLLTLLPCLNTRNNLVLEFLHHERMTFLHFVSWLSSHIFCLFSCLLLPYYCQLCFKYEKLSCLSCLLHCSL